MRSLTYKIMAAFALITLAAVSAVGLLASHAAVAELGNYVSRGAQLQAERLTPALARYYIDNNGWAGIQEAFLSTFTVMPMGRMMGMGGGPRWQESARSAMGSGWSVILADPAGVILADTRSAPSLGSRLTDQELQVSAPIYVDQTLVGLVLVLTEATEANLRLTKQFQQSVTRSVIVAGLVIGAFAVLTGFFLSRQILAPLSRLAAAAHRISAGDLSQRVAATGRDEVGELGRAFNNMADSLQRQEELRRRLVADVAHELRTPLAVIRGHLEALLDGVYPITPENVSAVLDEVLLLGRLTDDLRELALAEAGQLVLQRAPVYLSELAAKMMGSFGPLVAERQIALDFDVSPALPPVLADAQRLSQIFHNLLSNAIRHTPAGGRVRVSAQRLPDAPAVQISVSDTGAGIPPEDLPFIFDRFYRGGSSRLRSEEGTGLGLSIVKYILQAHGAEIAVRSAAGEGTTFTFALPIAEETSENQPTSLKREESL